MSPVLASTSQIRKISVRVFRALRDIHEDTVFLSEMSRTLPQAPPRPNAAAGHAPLPTTARRRSVTLSAKDQRLT
ncbi:MAG TPA: hypothetical protein VLW50_32750 [Streptosporangiaceae bacterium]|nr:hypothetical protein [Streptosporangiaceae bacterium]